MLPYAFGFGFWILSDGYNRIVWYIYGNLDFIVWEYVLVLEAISLCYLWYAFVAETTDSGWHCLLFMSIKVDALSLLRA